MRGTLAADAPGALDGRSEIIARLERLPFSRFHWKLAAILGVGTFFDAFDALAIAVALTVVFTTLHIGFMNAGFLISAAYVGQFVGAWAFGYLSERWGRKPAFVVALALFGVLSVATAFAWDFHSLMVLRLVQGLGLGGEVPVAGALFNEYLRTANRGRVALFYQSLFIWGAALTPVIGVAVFSLVGQDPGWRVLFMIGGIPALVAVYAAYALPESARWLADRDRIAEADRIIAGIEAEPRAGSRCRRCARHAATAAARHPAGRAVRRDLSAAHDHGVDPVGGDVLRRLRLQYLAADALCPHRRAAGE